MMLPRQLQHRPTPGRRQRPRRQTRHRPTAGRPIIGRHLAIVAAIGMLAAACGSSSPDGYDVADRVLAAVGQPVGDQQSGIDGTVDGAGQADQTAAAEDCTVVEVVDEYGFVDEVSTCQTGAPLTLANREPGPIDPAQVVTAEGDLPLWVLDELLTAAPDSARARLLPITASINALERACGVDFEAWTAALAELTNRAEMMSAAINNGELDGYVATAEAEAMSRSLMERSLLLTGCSSPGGGSPIPADQLIGGGTLELTARSAESLTELGRLLDGGASTFLFHFFSTGPNYHWLRTQPGSIDLIVYGTSQAGAGIEVPLLADQLSMSAGNAFLPGSLAEVQQHWFPEVERFVDPKIVVWLMGPIDLLIGCDTAGREEQFTERLTRRRRTFNPPGWFAEVEHINLILGPPGPENSNRGNAEKRPAPVQADIDAHLADYRDQLAAPEFCSSRADVVGRSVRRMLDDGRRVVVVGMPISPLAYEHLPGGTRAASAAIERLRSEQLADLDVEIIDLSDAVQDRTELWADYTHLTQDGSAAFTRILADALQDGPR